MHENINQKLNKYIDKNAPLRIRDRGKEIFLKGKLQLLSGPEGFPFHYKVIGSSGMYDVYLFNNHGKISSTCTCPYDFGPVCKHEVAAIFSVMDLNGGSARKEKFLSDEPQPISLEEAHINRLALQTRSHIPHTVRAEFQVQTLEKNKLVMRVVNENKFMAGSFEREANSTFEIKDEHIHHRCDCHRYRSGWCGHQALVLQYLNELGLKDFFYHLRYIDRHWDSAAKEYGIDDDAILKTHFKPVIRKGFFGVEPKDNEIQPLKGGDFFTEEPEKQIARRIGQDIRKDKRTFTNGYAFFFDTTWNNPFVLIPLAGKSSKAGKKLTSHLRELEYCPDPEMQEIWQECSWHHIKNSDSNGDVPLADLEKDIMAYHNILEEAWPFLQENLTYESREPYDVRKSDIVPLNFQSERIELEFELKEDEVFMTLQAFVKTDAFGKEPLSRNPGSVHPLLYKKGNSLFLHKSPDHAFLFAKFIKQPEVRVSKKGWQSFYQEIAKSIMPNYKVKKNLPEQKIIYRAPDPGKPKLFLKELEHYILFQPVMTYGDREVNILEKGEISFAEDDKIIIVQRDKEKESVFLTWLLNSHPDFQKRHHRDLLYLTPDEMAKDQWFLSFFSGCHEEGIELLGANKLKNFRYNTNRPSIKVQASSGIDWFDVSISVIFGDQKVSLNQIKKAVDKGDQFVTLGDGTIGMLPEEWLEKMQRYFRFGSIKNNKLEVSKLHFSLVDELFDNLDDEVMISEIAEKKSRLKAFQEVAEIEPPTTLKTELRHYQKAGLSWLHFLHEFQFGGILADDMGLGKTIQSLAFLLSIHHPENPPTLVIAPKTLVFNWEDEATKFAPSLKIHIHHGMNRQRNAKEFDQYDLVLTTYGTMSRDIKWLKEHVFHYVILDESQAIKNPMSKRYKAARLLQSRNRLALTGTPIENNTFDLYAQMNFLNPGFLGSQKHFQDHYSLPIDRDREEARAVELRKMVKPFLLRRTKEQVEQELPPKTEDILYCELEGQQRKVYTAFRNKYRDYVMGKIEKQGMERSKMYVLEGLTKLRQICNSPALLPDEGDFGSDSVKLDLLMEHITEKTGQHKVLIFSQFVKMLHLIRNEFDNTGINYAYLDGKTRYRKEEVARFQEEEECRVFLISLKAGGTGLNLTAADYVYVVDPWWNPAVEAQAIDRTHRIGQTKHVFSYKLICKDTVEEKIEQLKAQKLQVAGDIIQTEESFFKSLGKEELVGLFE